jgi:hypothetical protein
VRFRQGAYRIGTRSPGKADIAGKDRHVLQLRHAQRPAFNADAATVGAARGNGAGLGNADRPVLR